MRAPLTALPILLLAAAPAAADVHSVRTYDPRPFGYFTGDIIERSFEIEADAGDELTRASLPRPGALNYWLELRDVTHASATHAGRTIHTLTFIYQTFYAPIDPRKTTIPGQRLTITTGNGPEEVALPAFTFIASPLREIFPEKSGETSDTFLRPDPKAVRLSVLKPARWLTITSAASLLLLTLLARQLAWWPFHKRPARPFSRAARDIAHVLRSPGLSADAYREAALILHRAFDERAGERLFAADLPRFLERHPEHAPSASAIERFFNASRDVFFTEPSRVEAAFSSTTLRDLASALRREERGAR